MPKNNEQKPFQKPRLADQCRNADWVFTDVLKLYIREGVEPPRPKPPKTPFQTHDRNTSSIYEKAGRSVSRAS
jgi:hypothetical protein